MNYQKMILAGNVTGDAELKASKKRDIKYTTFSVGVSDEKDRTTFFPVVVFGKYGEAVAKHIRKGRQVLVEGRIALSDSGRFNVVASSVVFGSAGKLAKNQ